MAGWWQLVAFFKMIIVMHTAIKAILAEDMKLVGFGPQGHESREREREGKIESKEEYHEGIISYFDTWGCRSISSRSRLHNLRCSTMAAHPHQGSCRGESEPASADINLACLDIAVWQFTGGIFPIGSIKAAVENWLRFQREIILTVSVIPSPGGTGCS